MFARGLRRACARRAVLLLYHRIVPPSVDPWSLSVSPRHFEEHLHVLRKSCYPLGVSEFLRLLGGRGIPRRSVVITFDDGYADNLDCAKPLLEAHDIPATLFVVAGQGDTFWWDELERLILYGEFEIGQVSFSARGELHLLDTESPPVRAGEADSREGAGKSASTGRLEVYRQVWQVLRRLGPEERRDILARITSQVVAAPGYPKARRLDSDDIARLQDGGLVEIGAHTINHPILPTLSYSEQQAEIVGSKQALEQLTGKPVTGFSYPFGALSERTVEIVRNAGFSCACTTKPSAAWRYTDRFRLPRMAIEDYDGEVFGNRLASTFTRLEA
jgi:peptidoglycan/xylan/chitin deacetylase (PgdA/CDA1 family)